MRYSLYGTLIVIVTIFINSNEIISKGYRFRVKPIKVLMVVPSFPKVSDVCMLNQITGLIDRGFDVYIYAKNKGDFTTIQKEVKQYNLIERTFYGEFPQDLNSFDIITFQLGHKAFDIKKDFCFKGKVIICIRGYDISGYLTVKPDAYSKLLDMCDLFLPVCKEFKNRLIKLGVDRNKIIVHHSAIDCSKFKFKYHNHPGNKLIKIISVGRFKEKKGFEYAIKAVAQMVKKFSSIRYYIIGGGPLHDRYQKLIKELKLKKYIKVLGWHTHDELIKILDKAHILIAPSVTAVNGDQEGIPNVLKEAMAMGLPVISTYHAGISELIDNAKSGFLVSERNINALVKRLVYLITHPGVWRHLELAGRKKVEREFDTEIENDKLAEIYRRLVLSR